MRAPAYPEAAMRVGCCRNLMLAGHFRLAREALASELMHAPERGLLLCPVLGHCDRCVGFLLFTTPEQRLGADAGSFI